MNTNSNNPDPDPDRHAQWSAFRADHLLNAGIALLEDAADRGSGITLTPESVANIISWLHELYELRRREKKSVT